MIAGKMAPLLKQDWRIVCVKVYCDWKSIVTQGNATKMPKMFVDKK